METIGVSEALRRLGEGLGAREPFLLVTGESGTGKSALASETIARWGTRATAAFVSVPVAGPVELLEQLARRLGADPPEGATRQRLVATVEAALGEIAGRGQVAVIVVDDAHHLAPELIEELRLLTVSAHQMQRTLEVLLIGLPALEATLERNELAAVRQRVSARARLEPLTPGETRRYIRDRVSASGDDRINLFPRKTCSEIAELSGGFPRRINTLAAEALRLSREMGQHTVEPTHVREAAATLSGVLPKPDALDALEFGDEAESASKGVPRAESATAGTSGAPAAHRPVAAAPAAAALASPAPATPAAPAPAPVAKKAELPPAAPKPVEPAPMAKQTESAPTKQAERAATAPARPAPRPEPAATTATPVTAPAPASPPAPAVAQAPAARKSDVKAESAPAPDVAPVPAAMPTLAVAPAPAAASSPDAREWVARFLGDRGPIQISSQVSDGDVLARGRSSANSRTSSESPGAVPAHLLEAVRLDDAAQYRDDTRAETDPAAEYVEQVTRHTRESVLGLRTLTTGAFAAMALIAIVVIGVRAVGGAHHGESGAASASLTPVAPPEARGASPSRAAHEKPAATHASEPETPAEEAPETPAETPRGTCTIDTGERFDLQGALDERVRIETLTGMQAWVAPAGDRESGQYRVVIGIFRSYSRAEAAAGHLVRSHTLPHAAAVKMPPRKTRQ